MVLVRDELAIGKFEKTPEWPIHSRPNRPVVMVGGVFFVFFSGVSIDTSMAWASLALTAADSTERNAVCQIGRI